MNESPKANIIHFKSTKLSDIESEKWQEALSRVEKDDVVGIIHAALDGDAEYRQHVAEIPLQVGAHVHFIGDEDYKVVAGQGLLHYGLANTEGDVEWESPIEVNLGDEFIIPEGYAHQLQKQGDDNLIILFGCPDAHLDDLKDRLMLENSPFLK